MVYCQVTLFRVSRAFFVLPALIVLFAGVAALAVPLVFLVLTVAGAISAESLYSEETKRTEMRNEGRQNPK